MLTIQGISKGLSELSLVKTVPGYVIKLPMSSVRDMGSGVITALAKIVECNGLVAEIEGDLYVIRKPEPEKPKIGF